MLNIIPFKQTDDSRCGPASLKMVLGYYGLDISEDELCKLCNWTFELGCTDFQMKAAVEYLGYECEIKNESTLMEIRLFLSAGIPVIVDWFSPGIDLELHDMPNGHSSVVVDLDKDFIHLMDPEFGGIRSIRREDFLRVWFDWRERPILEECSDLVLRQILIIYPK